MESNNTYIDLAKFVLQEARTYLSEEWELVSKNERGTTLEKKSFIDAFPCYKLETTLNKSKEELVSKIWDVNESIVKKADPEIFSWRELESGSHSKVCHQFNSMPLPLYMRELLFVQAKIEKDETTWLVATSIKDHINKGSRPQWWCTTTYIHMSIWGFTAISQNQTRVTRIVHINPGGLIPVWLVDATVGKHVKIIEDLGE